MDIKILYNTPHEIPLGILIATYFYLTGLSAGSFVISVIANIGGQKQYKPIGRIGAILAPILLVFAPITLIVDLEQPFRFWHLFFYLNFTSPITYGSFLLTLYPINGIIYAWFTFLGNDKLTKFFGIIGIPIAIATHGYTGFILALGKGRALWSTALMPTLFIVSAMVSGIALVIIIAIIRWHYFSPKFESEAETQKKKKEDEQLILGLSKFMAGFVIFDLFLVFNDILVLLTSKLEESYVAKLILFGKFSPLFVGVELFLGGIVPLALIFIPKFGKSIKSVLLASILILIGVYAMRVVVVIAGQSIPLH